MAPKDIYFYSNETRYFGMFPPMFANLITNAANEKLYLAAEKFHQTLCKSESICTISPLILKDAMMKLLMLLEFAVDENFDILESYMLNNIFLFPNVCNKFERSSEVAFKNYVNGRMEILETRKKILLAKEMNRRLKKYQHTMNEQEMAFSAKLQSRENIGNIIDAYKSLTGRSLVTTILSLKNGMENLKTTTNRIKETYENNGRKNLMPTDEKDHTGSELECLREIGRLVEIQLFIKKIKVQ